MCRFTGFKIYVHKINVTFKLGNNNAFCWL